MLGELIPSVLVPRNQIRIEGVNAGVTNYKLFGEFNPGSSIALGSQIPKGGVCARGNQYVRGI